LPAQDFAPFNPDHCIPEPRFRVRALPCREGGSKAFLRLLFSKAS
jgi:hypothetical protein